MPFCVKKVGNVILLTDFANCDVLQHIENESELPKSCTANNAIHRMVEFTTNLQISLNDIQNIKIVL